VRGEGGGNALGDAAGGVSPQKTKAEGGEQQEEILKGGEEDDLSLTVLPGPALHMCILNTYLLSWLLVPEGK